MPTLMPRKNHWFQGTVLPAQPASSFLLPPLQAAISAENLEIIELNSAKINSICEKLHETILAIPEENPVCPILRDLCAVIHIQSENTKIIVDAIRHSATPPNALGPDKMEANLAYTLSDTEMESDSEPFSQMVSLGRIPKARNSLFPDGARGRQPRRHYRRRSQYCG